MSNEEVSAKSFYSDEEFARISSANAESLSEEMDYLASASPSPEQRAAQQWVRSLLISSIK